MSKFERTSTLVNRKFYHYLFPTILSNVAMSLNEFVDSILVSHLLGIDAVGMVNRGFPVMTGFALIYMCFGIGGSARSLQPSALRPAGSLLRTIRTMRLRLFYVPFLPVKWPMFRLFLMPNKKVHGPNPHKYWVL